MGKCMGSGFSWVGSLELDYLDLFPCLTVATRDFFRDEELELDQLAELGLTECLV